MSVRHTEVWGSGPLLDLLKILLVFSLIACSPPSEEGEGATKTQAPETSSKKEQPSLQPAPPKLPSRSARSPAEIFGAVTDPAEYKTQESLLKSHGRCSRVPNSEEQFVCWACKPGEAKTGLFVGREGELFLMRGSGRCAFSDAGEVTSIDFPFRDKRYSSVEKRRLVLTDEDKTVLTCGEELLTLESVSPKQHDALINSKLNYPGKSRKLQKLYRRPSGEVIYIQTLGLAKDQFKVQVAMGTPPLLFSADGGANWSSRATFSNWSIHLLSTTFHSSRMMRCLCCGSSRWQSSGTANKR